MTNRDNTATFCEIRNCVKIFLGWLVKEFLQFIDFGETYFVSNCSGLYCGLDTGL